MRPLAMLVIFALSLSAQVQTGPKKAPVHANPDQLGLTCAQILEMSSTDWITKFTTEKGPGAPTTIRGIGVYGKCYDARTDQLAAKLGRAGKGPPMGSRGSFQSMEQALKTFSAKALADSQPPADAVKSAYASLYEKQFRYEFYNAYEPKPAAAPITASQAANASAPVATAPASRVATANDKETAQSIVRSDSRADEKASDADPVTQAKNHFGALLGDLPDDQMHEVHGAFGGILGPNAAAAHMQLLVYRYAIFLLEKPGGQPFSPPPF